MKKSELKNKYEELFSYKDRELSFDELIRNWQQYPDRALTSYSAYEGPKYKHSNARLMVVGRAMNGWESDFSSCHSTAELAESVVTQKFDFDEIINGSIIVSDQDGRKRGYSYMKSNFWKLIKHVTSYLSDDPSTWNEQVVWTNLYKISPRFSGNPDWKLIKPTMQTHIDILQKEINLYTPKHILFITGMDYFHPWKRQPSFAKHFGIAHISQDIQLPAPIVAKGVYNDAKIIVCNRPDKWGTSNADVERMAETIGNEFNRI